MEPFQTSISNRISLLLSLCSLGFLAPLLINFRKSEYLIEEERVTELIINETNEETQQFQRAKLQRYKKTEFSLIDQIRSLD